MLAGRVHLDNIRAWFASVQPWLKAGAAPVKSRRQAMNQLHPPLAAAPVSVCVQQRCSQPGLRSALQRIRAGRAGGGHASPRTQESRSRLASARSGTPGTQSCQPHLGLCWQTGSVIVHELLQKSFPARAERASISAKISPKRRALSAEHQQDDQALCFQEGYGCHIIIKFWKMICIIKWSL